MGERQKGRLKAGSVIDCDPKKNQITSAIKRAISLDFKESCKVIKNLYGEGGASQKIIQTIESIALEDIIKKSFYDIKLR